MSKNVDYILRGKNTKAVIIKWGCICFDGGRMNINYSDTKQKKFIDKDQHKILWGFNIQIDRTLRPPTQTSYAWKEEDNNVYHHHHRFSFTGDDNIKSKEIAKL